MYLGIDLGTSAVKTVLVDDDQHGDRSGQRCRSASADRSRCGRSRIRRTGGARPQRRWQSCAARHARALAAVRAIGLSGQMHGATLLDAGDRVLRPAILWNDGRSGAECAELERRAPQSRAITGNLAMPGFTAPKLLWVAAHEPEVFRRVARVLLPKDYLRLRLTGEYASDMSDAAGTLWLDVARRAWSTEMLAATALTPAPCRGSSKAASPAAPCGASVATAWGMRADAIVAGGAGDNAAGAVGVGVIDAGDAFLSLGTSGVYFVAGDRFAPAPERGVHAFCHCLPATWHQMSVILSAASCLTLGDGADRRRERGGAARRGRAQPIAIRASSSCPTCPASARRTTIPTRQASSSA